MRKVSLATASTVLLEVLVALSVACGSDDPERKADAGARDAAIPDAAREPREAHEQDRDQDASTARASGAQLDLHALLIAALVETESSLDARCPCLAASGVYESMRACTEAVTLGRNWIDCVNGLDLTAQDDPEIRANLYCNIQELRQRSECLMGSSCSDEDVTACMNQTLNCPKLPLELLSQVAVECQIAFSR